MDVLGREKQLTHLSTKQLGKFFSHCNLGGLVQGGGYVRESEVLQLGEAP